MNADLHSLFRKYRALRESQCDDRTVQSLYDSIRDRRERSALRIANEVADFAANLGASISVSYTDSLDFSALSPQVREAFELAYPGIGPESLSGLTDPQLNGYLAAWKGKLFEVMVRDELNAGGSVGSLVLSSGQSAVLADSPTQPGWDLRIIEESGATVDQVQLKATQSLEYLKQAVEKFPDIQVWSTDEAVNGAAELGDHIHASGISLDEVHDHLAKPLEELSATHLEHFNDSVFPWTPFVLIVSTEGITTLAGRQTFSQALNRSLYRIGRSVAIRFSVIALKVLGFGTASWVVAPAFHIVISRYQSAHRVEQCLGRWSEVLGAVNGHYRSIAPELTASTDAVAACCGDAKVDDQC